MTLQAGGYEKSGRKKDMKTTFRLILVTYVISRGMVKKKKRKDPRDWTNMPPGFMWKILCKTLVTTKRAYYIQLK